MDNGLVRGNGLTPTGRNTGERLNTPEPKNKKNNTMRKRIVIAVATLLLLAALLLGGFFWYRSSTSANIDSSKYQAVFLTGNMVYFGKLQTLNGNYMKLTDIFYLQAQDAATADSKNLQTTSNQATPDVQLIKLGSEIHGPVDEMIISKDQILFFENLKKDGKVTDSINKYQSQK